MMHLLRMIRYYKRSKHDHPCIHELNKLMDASWALRFLVWIGRVK